MMRAAVITFPGSNCDDDCTYALSKICDFKVDCLWHKDTPDLSPYQLVVLPGGFSYGDYLRCGAIASLSPISDSVRAYARKGGKLLGTCNGFQILCEMQLLPGALIRNQSLSFVCKDVGLKIENRETPWTCLFKQGETLSLPIAHGDGRFEISESEYEKAKAAGQILLTYTENPNGSRFNIAGICNAEKNVFGLMPHPERATDLRSKDGLKIWKSVIHSLSEKGI